jgi:probable rRNA maturation factor
MEAVGAEAIEVEIAGRRLLEGDAPSDTQLRRLCALAAASADVHEGHLAIAFVEEAQIAELNARHRGKPAPTDVLSFPIDGADARPAGPRELGDVVICPPRARDVCEAVVHGVLHLLGMDHERDEGQMLALQAELLRWETLADAPRAAA